MATLAEKNNWKEKKQTSQSAERQPLKNITSMLSQANNLWIMRLHKNMSSTISRTEETMSLKQYKNWLRPMQTNGNQH